MDLDIAADGFFVLAQIAIMWAVRRIAPLCSGQMSKLWVSPLHDAVQCAGFKTQSGDTFIAELVRLTQRTFYGDAAVAKFMRFENFGGEGFGRFGLRIGRLTTAVAFSLSRFIQLTCVDDFKVAKALRDGADIVIAHLIALATQGFAHLAAEVAAVDQLYQAFAFGGFFVRQDPDVGGDAGVIEHVGGQGDDSFEQIGF